MLNNTGVSKRDKMLSYMNEKYDDHFEYLAPFGGGPGAVTKQITVKSEKYPDAKIWVEYYTKDGEDVFADNYVDYRYEQQTRDALQDLLEDVFEGNVILSFGVGTKGLLNGFTNDTTFKQYTSSPESDIGFNAVVSDNRKFFRDDVIESRLLAAFDRYEIIAKGTIYFANNENTFKSLNDLTTDERHSLRCLTFSMIDLLRFDTCEWR